MDCRLLSENKTLRQETRIHKSTRWDFAGVTHLVLVAGPCEREVSMLNCSFNNRP